MWACKQVLVLKEFEFVDLIIDYSVHRGVLSRLVKCMSCAYLPGCVDECVLASYAFIVHMELIN
jgi:hypothetical protein